MYNILGSTCVTIKHNLKTGDFSGVLPAPAVAEISAGLANWKNLDAGGLFFFNKKAVIVEHLLSVGCTATWLIVDADGNTIRPTPSVFPFKLSPGENLKATSTGGTTNAVVGMVAKLEEQKCI